MRSKVDRDRTRRARGAVARDQARQRYDDRQAAAERRRAADLEKMRSSTQPRLPPRQTFTRRDADASA